MLAWFALAFWFGAAGYMASGARGAVFGPTHRGDPMRLACFFTALIFCSYILRSIYWPDSETSATALRLAGMVDAVYIIRLGRAYGRGERL